MTSPPAVASPFEGPEKKLCALFRAHRDHPCASLRAISRARVHRILQSASCSVLSVCRNAHFDAYLLSESSLFVSDHLLVIKTCGTTTLLNALSHIFHAACALHLVPVSLSFSRVRYSFPDAQLFPHDCFENEVAFIDAALHARRIRFDKFVHTRSNWYLYHARFASAPDLHHAQQHQSRCTLDICMFDLDEQCMSSFRYNGREQLIGVDTGLVVTEQSGVARLVHDCDVVDAFNFAPCGYSMNALSSYTYSTVHVTPERDASYVSFEVSGHLHSVSLVVAKAVRLFKPKSFTLSLLGAVLETHEQCANVSKLLQADFTNLWPLSNMQVGDMYATVCSFRANAQSTRIAAHHVLGRMDSVAFNVGKRFEATAVEHGVSGVQLADKLVSNSRRVGTGGATLMVDLSSVEREMNEARNTVGQQVELRYLVKMNAARGVLAVLNEMGAWFEASDEVDVNALESVGVCRERIVLVSTVVGEQVLGRVGAVAVFGGGETVEMASRCGVCVEIHVVHGFVSQVQTVLKEVVARGARVSGVAFDGQVDVSAVEGVVKSVCDVVRDGRLRVVGGELGEGVTRGRAHEVCRMVQEMRVEGVQMQAVATVGARVVREAVSVRLEVVGRRRREDGPVLYYLSDGAYGVLNAVMKRGGRGGARVCASGRGEVRQAVLFGPTCDSLDVVWRGSVREMGVGDFVVVGGVAQYGGATAFNGFGGALSTVYFARV